MEIFIRKSCYQTVQLKLTDSKKMNEGITKKDKNKKDAQKNWENKNGDKI